MSRISKPVDWEVFSIPPVQPVHYYSILKRKREFSQRQCDTQVFKHGYLHYCGIVPKNVNSSINSRYEIIIVFFDEIPSSSFIGFRVKVSKESYVNESNSLLLFLKKSKKAIFYLMNNNYIHVQCGTNAWELFYCLYDDYLRRYVLTFIGTQFFYHFVYSLCIKKEIQLLEILYKASKVIRVSKKSIYYKIHRKRKISVTDLIHMTLNMPKSKRYVISCFSAKEPLLYSNLNDGDFYTAVGSKINVSKLILKKLKQPFGEMPASSNAVYPLCSQFSTSKLEPYKSDKLISTSNAILKRKFEEIENNKNDLEPEPSTFKLSKTSSSNADQWELYQNLKPYTVKKYSGTSCLSHLVPNLVKNGNLSHFVSTNCYLLNTDCNVPVLSSTLLNKEEISNMENFEETYKNVDDINLCCSSKQNTKNETEQIILNKKSNEFTFLNPQNHESQELPFSKKSGLDNNKPSAILSRITRIFNQDCTRTAKDVSFTTGAGKPISISNTAMLTAQKLIQDECSDGNQQALYERVNCDPNETFRKTASFKNYHDYKRKSATDYIPPAKISANKPIHGIKFLKSDEGTSKHFESVLSSKDENFRLDHFDTLEDLSFSTASGKKINVSNNAMQAAHKLIQDVFNEERIPITSESISLDTSKNKICKNRSDFFKDIGCSSKMSVDVDTVDVDMNNTLVEKFFEDTLFDENELESTVECKKTENSDLNLASKDDKKHSSRKPKKSLGGRRSMRYCSDTL